MHPLIMLFGMPRSGTTWLGKIFDSHPRTIYRHEPDSWRLLSIPLLTDPHESMHYESVATRFVGNLAHMCHTKVSATLPVFPKEYLSTPRYWATRGSVSAARIASRLIGEVRVPQWVDPNRTLDAPIVWKSVESTGRFGLLATLFPASRAILILRHPCGYVASLLRGEAASKFTSQDPASEDYGIFEMLAPTAPAKRRGLTLDAFRAMTPVERLAWCWALFNEKAMEEVANLTNCTVIKYEDVCGTPIPTARRLFEFAGLPWAAQTDEFIRASTSRDQSGYYSVFKDPLRAANRWREELSEDQVRQIEAVAAQTAPGRLYVCNGSLPGDRRRI